MNEENDDIKRDFDDVADTLGELEVQKSRENPKCTCEWDRETHTRKWCEYCYKTKLNFR